MITSGEVDSLSNDGIRDLSVDSELVREIRHNIKVAKDYFSKWRRDAITDYDFYAGNQWSEEDLAKLRESGRPPIVFNRTVRVVNAIVGLQLQNRQDIVYMPREKDDGINSQLLTGAAKWVRESCDASDEESQAFKDSLISGMGWIETHLSYENDPDGEIIIERVDPLEMLADPSAKKRNLDDARWIARIKAYTKREFKKLWPDIEITSTQIASFFDSTDTGPIDVEQSRFYRDGINNDSERSKDKVEVVQYQYYDLEKFNRLVYPDDTFVLDEKGSSLELSDDEMSGMKSEIMLQGIRVLKQTRRRYKQVFIYGDEILESGDSPINRFTFRCMTGLQDRNQNTWFGLMKIVRDPQMYSNKWLSQILYIINSNAKGGYLVEEGAVKSHSKFSQDIASPDKTVELREGGLNKIRLKEQIQYPVGIDRLMNYAMEATNELVGVNLEMLGLANRNQAGVLEAQRKDAGVTVLSDFFEALTRYYKEQGRVLADFIIEYISDGRLIRVVGTDLGEYVPLMKESINFKYDIAVDETPTSPTQRQKTFDTLTQLIPQMVQMGIPVPPDVLDYAPLPPTLIKKWKDEIEAQQPSENEQLAEEVKKQLAQLEIEYNQLRNDAIAQEMELEKLKVQNQMMKEQAALDKQEVDSYETETKAELNLAKAEREQILATKDANEILNEDINRDLQIMSRITERY